MTNDKAMREAARVFDPELFSDPTLYTEPESAVRDVEAVRAKTLTKIERAITAYLASKLQDAPGVVSRLQKRFRSVLPDDWQKGRKCPECGSDADRPNCVWGIGSCPRLNPDNYEPSPYLIVPDETCREAADVILALTAENDRMKALLDGL